MNKSLCISAAIAMALSGAAFAKGGAHSRSSASAAMPTESAQFTQKDCEMLSVASARDACMQSAARSNGGVDAAAVGSTTGSSMRPGPGSQAGATSIEADKRSNAGIDPSAVGGTSSRGAMGEGRKNLKADAPVKNSSPDSYNAGHR